jgi:hypothetical protein
MILPARNICPDSFVDQGALGERKHLSGEIVGGESAHVPGHVNDDDVVLGIDPKASGRCATPEEPPVAAYVASCSLIADYGESDTKADTGLEIGNARWFKVILAMKCTVCGLRMRTPLSSQPLRIICAKRQ